MQIKVQQLQTGKEVVLYKESSEQIISHILSKGLGFRFEDNTLMWDYAYVMFDDIKGYNKGFEQEKLLKSYGLL